MRMYVFPIAHKFSGFRLRLAANTHPLTHVTISVMRYAFLILDRHSRRESTSRICFRQRAPAHLASSRQSNLTPCSARATLFRRTVRFLENQEEIVKLLKLSTALSVLLFVSSAAFAQGQ